MRFSAVGQQSGRSLWEQVTASLAADNELRQIEIDHTRRAA
jgi:hypothetical protein